MDDSASPRPFWYTAESLQTQKLCFNHQFSLIFNSSRRPAGNCHQYMSHVGNSPRSFAFGCCLFEQHPRWWACLPCDLILEDTAIRLVGRCVYSLLHHREPGLSRASWALCISPRSISGMDACWGAALSSHRRGKWPQAWSPIIQVLLRACRGRTLPPPRALQAFCWKFLLLLTGSIHTWLRPTVLGTEEVLPARPLGQPHGQHYLRIYRASVVANMGVNPQNLGSREPARWSTVQGSWSSAQRLLRLSAWKPEPAAWLSVCQ